MGDAQQAQPRITAKHPPEFSLKQSYSTWSKQFRNYCELLQIPNNTRYRTLLCFLDPESFTIVENLNLEQAQRDDIFANATHQLLKNALSTRESQIPPGYALKFRKQKEGEGIEKYAAELEKLALEAYPDDQNIRQNRNLIESFISGIRNDELAIKLLQENFENLGQAITTAVQYFQALQTRRFIKTESDFRPAMEKVYNISKENQESSSTNAVNSTNNNSNKDQAVQNPQNQAQNSSHQNY